MRPDSLRVLGERLRRGERASRQQREGTTCSRQGETYQTAWQRRSHGHTHQGEGFGNGDHVNSSVVLSNRKMKARVVKLLRSAPPYLASLAKCSERPAYA